MEIYVIVEIKDKKTIVFVETHRTNAEANKSLTKLQYINLDGKYASKCYIRHGKGTFEECSNDIKNMIKDGVIWADDFKYVGFDKVIIALKDGHAAKRKGWHGENMYIYKQIPKVFTNLWNPLKYLQGLTGRRDDRVETKYGHINFVSADGSLVVGWVPTSPDMFAEDWEIIVIPPEHQDRGV